MAVTQTSDGLTWDDVRTIRHRHDVKGESQNEISRDYPVSQGMVSLIVRREVWVDE